MEKCFTRPTLKATPGDLSLVIPKRQLDNIIEMIYALDKIAPGTANEDTLLYGVEVKFYNSKVQVNHRLETKGRKDSMRWETAPALPIPCPRLPQAASLAARTLIEKYK